jgi:predicted flap endonuclease-1-like 5' DNA nuclease
MRSDYALYIVALICFIITGVAAYQTWANQQLWVVATVVLGLVFIGVGYTQRPREPVTTQMAVAPPPPPLATTLKPQVTEVREEKKPEEAKPEPVVQAETAVQAGPAVEVKPPSLRLLDVKGIKDKRARQLKALGINTVEDLAEASAEDLAAKLKIAPYFTRRWIENAKEILKKS